LADPDFNLLSPATWAAVAAVVEAAEAVAVAVPANGGVCEKGGGGGCHDDSHHEPLIKLVDHTAIEHPRTRETALIPPTSLS